MARIPVTMANVGERVTIYSITGNDKIRQHLAELGFVVGGCAVVVSRISGNMIVQVKDSRVALDQSMASRIKI
jgi:ferrous iron transport protein A